jgi:hypothetical protein
VLQWDGWSLQTRYRYLEYLAIDLEQIPKLMVDTRTHLTSTFSFACYLSLSSVNIDSQWILPHHWIGSWAASLIGVQSMFIAGWSMGACIGC